jgi:hypothetical protein
MSNVNQYVNVMQRSGIKMAVANPNSEMSHLSSELIEHYKNNRHIAVKLIDDIEKENTSVTGALKLHYDAAVVAVRGRQVYNAPLPLSNPVPKEPTQADELTKLASAGWTPFVSKQPQLLKE